MTSNRNGARHSPRERAKHWGRKQTAYLGDEISGKRSYYNIRATLLHDDTDIDVSRQDPQIYQKDSPSRRYFAKWLVMEQRGINPDVSRIAGSMIHIACTPPANLINRDKEDRPYPDILFLDGELELTVISETERKSQTLSVGTVVGLTIIRQGIDFPVW